MSGKGQDPIGYGACIECGYLMLPVLPLSPCGHDALVEEKPLDELGEVYSWTRFRLGESERLLVMVDFFGGKLRVTAPLVETESVAIGDRVRIVPGGDTPYAFVPSSVPEGPD